MTPRRIVLLGSTGSVGEQTVDIVQRERERFRVVGLAAGGSQVEALARQAIDLGVEVVAVANATAAQDLQLALYAHAQARGWSAGEVRLPRIVTGPDAASEVAALPCDVVVNAITGSIGLAPTLSALRAGRTLALANKESLIVGGRLVTELAEPGQIVPLDSEHSAIAQCLRAGSDQEVRRLVVTASGGPFRGRRRDDLAAVTPQQALAHPTWDMGPVVTVNSATLVNKGLEVIEAHLLFGVPYDRITVVVHPQSVVHSMVEFHDGSTIAQASPPDMRLPISLGLDWPHRVADAAAAVDWTAGSTWEFAPLDESAFPAVALAREVGRRASTFPAVFNAANEVCVEAFLAGRLPFLGIVDTVAAVVARHCDEIERGRVPGGLGNSAGLADVLEAESWARTQAARQVAAIGGGQVEVST